MKTLARFALPVALAVTGCNSDPVGTQPSPPFGLEAGAPAPATPRRMAFHRNPFGDALQADNLMVDGDFELTGRTDQAPWLAFDPNQGQQALTYDTGGHCRSGIRCAVLADPQVLIGYMGSPLLANVEVRAYAKVSSGKCSDLSLLAFDLAANAAGKYVNAVGPTPAADGWCVYEGETDNLALKQPALYMTVSASSKATATIDEVSVLPLGEAPIHGITQPLGEIDAATRARLVSIGSWVRAHRKFGRDPAKREVR